VVQQEFEKGRALILPYPKLAQSFLSWAAESEELIRTVLVFYPKLA